MTRRFLLDTGPAFDFLIQQIDMQVATIALTFGNCTVVSVDQDLKAVPGLTVEDWTQ